MSRLAVIQPPNKFKNGILLAEPDRFWAREIQKLSRTNLNNCFQCRTCSNGCPFVRAMEYPGRPGGRDYEGWFARHLVDPRSLLQERRLIA